MDNSRIRKKYLWMMWEIDKRLEVLKALVNGNADVVYLKAKVESEALQLRKILELIAFSSLVAHKEKYKEVRSDMDKDWHAKRIIKKIKLINPDFYPIPTKGYVKDKWVDVRGGYLTKKQFEAAYDLCGDMLHARNPFAKLNRSAMAFDKRVPDYIERIEKLLEQHRVILPDNLGVIHVQSNFGSNKALKIWLYKSADKETQ
ncbi:MAG: hypothetical protein LRY66_17450 [Saccharospirillaceae bacterium]|nr:hypothetical protein [Saccharospirillaceae bacterium]MCD8533090.1 hypothetical protein [Saccharospirillaceae bacterium]